MKTVILVPYFIENVLKRNRHALADALDYEVLKKFISLDDLRMFLKFQESSFSNSFGFISRSVLFNSWVQRSQCARSELDSDYIPLANSEKDNDTIKEMLSLTLGQSQDDTKPYAVIDISREIVAVVVRPGLNEYLEKKEGQLQIVRDILKALYASAEVHEVSSTPLFKKYVELLSP